MKHVLLGIAVYTSAVLEAVGAPAAIGLGGVDLFAVVALVCLRHGRGNLLLGWLAVVGLLSDVFHQSPLGIAMAIAVGLGYGFEGTTARGTTGTRWLAGASFVVLFQLLVTGVRGGLAGSPIGPSLASAIVPAAVTLVAVLLAQVGYVAVRTLFGGRGLRTSRHGF